jgi:hypothetical protein
VPVGLTRIRPALLLALALSLAVIAALLAQPSQALAAARRASCSSLAPHLRHRGHACRRLAHKQRVHRHGASRARHAARPATGSQKTAGTASATPPTTTTPTCEDGANAIYAPDGSVSCQDGSEPRCEDGSDPTLAGNGSRQVCDVTGASGSEPAGPACEAGAASCPAGSSGPACEDGSAPLRGANGAFACRDGSEVACEDGSDPSLASDGTLVCDAATRSETAGE